MVTTHLPASSACDHAASPIDPQSICVVGSGPVGLAFALRLANAGHAVALIDSGKFSDHDQGRDFTLGTVVNAATAEHRLDPTLIPGDMLYQYFTLPDYLAWSRWLGSGGAANRWGVQWRPLTESRLRLVPGALADFDARPELDIPAWAAPAIDIHRRYQDALAFFALAEQTFDVDTYRDAYQPLALSDQVFPRKLFHFARADVVYQQRLQEAIAHPGIDIRSNLHLLRLETAHQARVTALVLVDRDGNEHRIECKHYVLALGGIENARQLLLAKQDGALADPHDVFGRWYCDHPHIRLGFLTGKPPEALVDAAAWYDFQSINGTPVLRGHELSSTVARELGLLRCSIDLVGRSAGYCSRSGVAFAQALDAAKRKHLPALVAALAQLALSPITSCKLAYEVKKTPYPGVHGTHLGGWSDPATRQHKVETLAIEAMFEQRPSPDNRVRLGTTCDRLGRPLPVLQWAWSRKEVAAINKTTDFVADALRQTGMGNVVTMRQLGQGEIPRAGSGFHHLGGTRQSHDPAEGVVDAANRVHGVDNLTLIGSSVFPNTVGFANPTLTAVADALRVADSLAESSATATHPDASIATQSWWD